MEEHHLGLEFRQSKVRTQRSEGSHRPGGPSWGEEESGILQGYCKNQNEAPGQVIPNG